MKGTIATATLILAIVGALLASSAGSDDGTAVSKQYATAATDGRIVFDDDNGPVYTINPDGSERVRIARGHEFARWSHDGSRISLDKVTANDGVTTAVVNPDGSQLDIKPIPDRLSGLVCIAWTPSDRRIACEGWGRKRAAGIFTIRTRDWQGLHRVTRNPLGGNDIPGDYSPDGSRIAFLREDAERERIAVFVARADGRRARRVSAWGEQHTTPRWSPDGRSLLYDDERGGLIVQRPNGEGRTRLDLDLAALSLDAAFQPAWSPDGQRIVFIAFGEEIGGIYVADADGSNVQPVATTASGFFSNPDWGAARASGAEE